MTLGFSKNILYYGLSQLPQVLSGLVVSIISTRLLGPTFKGVYAIVNNDMLLLSLLLNLGIQVSTPYFLGSKKATPSEIVNLGLRHMLVNLVFICLVLLIAHASIGADQLVPDAAYLISSLAFIVLGFLMNYFNALLNAVFVGTKKIAIVNRGLLLSAMANGLCFLLLVVINLYREVGLTEVLITLLITNAISTGYWIWNFSLEFGWHRVDPGQLRSVFAMMISFSLISYVSNILNFLNYRLDLYFLEYWYDMEQVGLYSLAVNLIFMSWMLSEPIATILSPYLSSPEFAARRIEIAEAFIRLNSTVILVFTGFAAALAHWAIPFVYGIEFSLSVGPFLVLLIGNYFACNAKVHSIINYANKQVRFNLIATALALAATIIFDLWFIPEQGIYGAAWASNIAYFVLFITLIYFERRHGHIRHLNLFILGPRDIKLIKHVG